MTSSEQAAYARSVKDARQMAMIAAVTTEARDDHLHRRSLAAMWRLHLAGVELRRDGAERSSAGRPAVGDERQDVGSEGVSISLEHLAG